MEMAGDSLPHALYAPKLSPSSKIQVKYPFVANQLRSKDASPPSTPHQQVPGLPTAQRPRPALSPPASPPPAQIPIPHIPQYFQSNLPSAPPIPAVPQIPNPAPPGHSSAANSAVQISDLKAGAERLVQMVALPSQELMVIRAGTLPERWL
jgi:hypothetical protein